MHRSSILSSAIFAALLLMPRAEAQTVVFPATHTNLEGSSYTTSGFPYSLGVSHSQAIFSRQFLGLPNGASIRRIGVRPDANANALGHRIRLEIQMVHTLVEVVNVSSQFSANFTETPVTVYTPKLFTLPNLTPTPPGPSSAVIWVDLDTPFVYNATKNLLVDFKISANDFGNQAFTYPLDLATYIATNQTLGSSCTHSNNATPVLSATGGAVYGSWNISLTNSLVTTPCALHIGYGNTNWSGIPLPFALDSLGAPGCSLIAEFPIVYPAVTTFGGTAYFSAYIPNDLQFYARTFYAQILLLDFFANNLGVVTTNAVGTTFGAHPQMTHNTSQGSTTALYGGIYAYDGTVFSFQYQ